MSEAHASRPEDWVNCFDCTAPSDRAHFSSPAVFVRASVAISAATGDAFRPDIGLSWALNCSGGAYDHRNVPSSMYKIEREVGLFS